MKNSNRIEQDISVDRLTNSIINVISGDSFLKRAEKRIFRKIRIKTRKIEQTCNNANNTTNLEINRKRNLAKHS